MIGFHVAVIALDERCSDQLHPLPVDSLGDVGARHRQQIADVLGVFQEELDRVFPELPDNLQDSC
jgi:hypothetical protein